MLAIPSDEVINAVTVIFKIQSMESWLNLDTNISYLFGVYSPRNYKQLLFEMEKYRKERSSVNP